MRSGSEEGRSEKFVILSGRRTWKFRSRDELGSRASPSLRSGWSHISPPSFFTSHFSLSSSHLLTVDPHSPLPSSTISSPSMTSGLPS